MKPFSPDPHLLDTFKLEMSQGMERFFLLSYCLVCCWPGLGAKSELRVVRQWAVLDFNFPSEEARAEALEKQYFVPGNSVPIDVDVHHRQGRKTNISYVSISPAWFFCRTKLVRSCIVMMFSGKKLF